MGWYVAPALDKLLAQLNSMAPNRSKKSDGSIGDTAHKAGKSEHNPDWDGEVDARDFTHDPANGADMHVIAERLRASRDKRILYVIWNRRYFSPKTGWQWMPYTGPNPHDKHMHVSVADPYDNETSEWAIGGPGVVTVVSSFPAFPGRDLKVVSPRMTGTDVRAWQAQMRRRGWRIEVDGVYGPASAEVARKFQGEKGLKVDGVVGPNTWNASFSLPIT